METTTATHNATTHLQELVQETYEKFKNVDDGKVATYIPELSKANPDHFGICLATVDGKTFCAGDWQQEFTIQSICKPFAFLMALEEFGRDAVLEKVCVEPSGDAFNADRARAQDHAPVQSDDQRGGDRDLVADQEILARLRRPAFCEQDGNGRRPASWDRSSRACFGASTGNRNRAIAYLMLNCGIIDAAVDHALHQYFSQCSLLVNCQDLAMMSATLANMGINPVTRQQAFGLEYVKDVLAVMFTCGLYDYAGEWAYRVGLPAEERRRRRHRRGGESPVGNCGLLSEAGRQGQQRPGNRGVQGTGPAPGLARVRVHQRRVELHAVAVVGCTRRLYFSPAQRVR